ncbi:hypothetical protein JCM8097_000214 [Rhodosporidiobolus ruineniae]
MPSQLPYVICSGLLVVLNSGPLYWQFKQGNPGPIAMGFWVVLLNLREFVNCVVWYNDAINRSPIFCDISIKISIGGQVGRLAAVYCIARFLADVVSPRATAIMRQDRRRRAIHDYFVSIGVPVLIMACHIVYQANRFALYQGEGCLPTQFMSWPTLILRVIWGPIFAVGGVFYSAYTVYRLIRHRRNFNRVVAGAHSALTTTRFIRLAALSISYLLIGVPLTIYSTITLIMQTGRYYDYSWAYFRSAWEHQPVAVGDTPLIADFPTWSNVIVGVIFFAAFGLGTEATEAYKKAARLCLPRRTEPLWPSSSDRSPTKRSWFRRRQETNLDDQARPIQISTRDMRGQVAYAAGVKVVIETEEDIV